MTRSIVHLTTYLQGGAGRSIVDVACAQRAAGHHVLVVTSRSATGGYGNYPHYLDRLAAAGVPFWLEDSLFERRVEANQPVLDRLRAERPPASVDTVHAHAGVPARIGLAFAEGAARRPVVVQTQHGWGANKTAEQSRADLETLAAVDAVLVTSEGTRALLYGMGIPTSRMTVVPCGLPAESPPPSRPAVALASRYRAQGRIVVGCVGSVTPNKNQALVLAAVAASQSRPLAAVIVGEGGDGLGARCHELGVADAVHLAGYQRDADTWMPAFDVLAVPSFTEGQGLVVLEAFRAGVPVVASRIPALCELVQEGSTGWLFDPRDARSLIAALTRAIELGEPERQRVRRSARAIFDGGYTTAAMLGRLERVYGAIEARFKTSSLAG
ncbi:MAG TPA: glycosyltransferase family 4 protein [Vicinamibacterales bacterium]